MYLTNQFRLNRVLILYIFLMLLATKSLLFAEDSDPEFKSLSFNLRFITNTNRIILHHYWEPGIGGEAEVKVPFYAGKLSAGLHIFQFNGRSETYPDYSVNYFYMGWGVDLPINESLNWYNGIRLGSYQMNFDDTDINPTQRVESELAAGVDSGIYLKIFSQWQGHIAVGYSVVFTYKKIELLNLLVGISYTINTPFFLSEFLK